MLCKSYKCPFLRFEILRKMVLNNSEIVDRKHYPLKMKVKNFWVGIAVWNTAQKMKFFIKQDTAHLVLRLLKKSLKESFIFCAEKKYWKNCSKTKKQTCNSYQNLWTFKLWNFSIGKRQVEVKRLFLFSSTASRHSGSHLEFSVVSTGLLFDEN